MSLNRVWEKDIKFLSVKAKEHRNKDIVLLILNRIKLSKSADQSHYIVNLNEQETDVIEDFLGDLICEIGIDNTGEINQTGRYIDDLIDIFNPRNLE